MLIRCFVSFVGRGEALFRVGAGCGATRSLWESFGGRGYG